MKNGLIRFVISAVAVWLTAYLLKKGIAITPWWVSIVVAVVLGIINTVIRPFVKLLALPVTILTLGLFSLVINAIMVLLCAWIVPGFTVMGFWWAMGFSIVLALVSWFLNLIFAD